MALTRKAITAAVCCVCPNIAPVPSRPACPVDTLVMLLLADEEALAELQEQVASSLPQLASSKLDPQQLLRTAVNVEIVMDGILTALHEQARRAVYDRPCCLKRLPSRAKAAANASCRLKLCVQRAHTVCWHLCVQEQRWQARHLLNLQNNAHSIWLEVRRCCWRW